MNIFLAISCSCTKFAYFITQCPNLYLNNSIKFTSLKLRWFFGVWKKYIRHGIHQTLRITSKNAIDQKGFNISYNVFLCLTRKYLMQRLSHLWKVHPFTIFCCIGLAQDSWSISFLSKFLKVTSEVLKTQKMT